MSDTGSADVWMVVETQANAEHLQRLIDPTVERILFGWIGQCRPAKSFRLVTVRNPSHRVREEGGWTDARFDDWFFTHVRPAVRSGGDFCWV